MFFLHDDVEVLTDSWVEEMVGVLQYPGVGAVGASLLYPDLSIQHAGVVVGIGDAVGYPHRLHFDRLSAGYFGRLQLIQCPSAVSWACMGVRRDAFESVGGFSEDTFTGIFGDVDFCLRLGEAGWRTGWTRTPSWSISRTPGTLAGSRVRTLCASIVRSDCSTTDGDVGSKTTLPTTQISLSPTRHYPSRGRLELPWSEATSRLVTSLSTYRQPVARSHREPEEQSRS